MIPMITTPGKAVFGVRELAPALSEASLLAGSTGNWPVNRSRRSLTRSSPLRYLGRQQAAAGVRVES